jgi:hypothetical protein
VNNKENRRGVRVMEEEPENPANIIYVCQDCGKDMYPNKGKLDAKVGDFVKLKFRGEKRNEYMWVEVKRVHVESASAKDDEYNFEGVLSNDPVIVKDMKCGDKVIFRKEDILDIFTD